MLPVFGLFQQWGLTPQWPNRSLGMGPDQAARLLRYQRAVCTQHSGSADRGRVSHDFAALMRPPSRATWLDQHRFRPRGKLVVGNLDRIANIDDIGD
jgi:hypothetical protein